MITINEKLNNFKDAEYNLKRGGFKNTHNNFWKREVSLENGLFNVSFHITLLSVSFQEEKIYCFFAIEVDPQFMWGTADYRMIKNMVFGFVDSMRKEFGFPGKTEDTHGYISCSESIINLQDIPKTISRSSTFIDRSLNLFNTIKSLGKQSKSKSTRKRV